MHSCFLTSLQRSTVLFVHCALNIVAGLKVIFTIAKAIFKLAGRIQKAGEWAKKIVRAEDFTIAALFTNTVEGAS